MIIPIFSIDETDSEGYIIPHKCCIWYLKGGGPKTPHVYNLQERMWQKTKQKMETILRSKEWLIGLNAWNCHENNP